MLKYIIYTPLYRIDSGGVIALFKLCRVLNELGAEALIWPLEKPDPKIDMESLKKAAQWYPKTIVKFMINYKDVRASLRCRWATKKDIAESIVIYPEIVDGNPLEGEHVVRWLLNKPGAITGSINYSRNELFFYFDKHFDEPDLNPNSGNHLNVIDLLEDIYSDKGDSNRIGSCYMVRKGKDRKLDQHDKDSICVDDYGHEEMARMFNKCKYFISYDLYTMYSVYAAICGCIPVIIPKPDVSIEQWHSIEENRYGLAYGWEQVQWAVDTRDKLKKHLKKAEMRAQDSVKSFIEITQKHFSVTRINT